MESEVIVVGINRWRPPVRPARFVRFAIVRPSLVRLGEITIYVLTILPPVCTKNLGCQVVSWGHQKGRWKRARLVLPRSIWKWSVSFRSADYSRHPSGRFPVPGKNQPVSRGIRPCVRWVVACRSTYRSIAALKWPNFRRRGRYVANKSSCPTSLKLIS